MAERIPSDTQNQSGRNTFAGRLRTKKLAWRIGVLIAALLSSLLTLPMLVFGIGVAMPVVSLLMLIVAALFASIGASWFDTLLAPTRTRTRLLPVVGVCEVIAVALAILMFVLAAFVDTFILLPGGVALVALGASWATWRFRGSRTRMGWAARLTLALAAAVFVVSYELLASGFIGIGVLELLFYMFIAPLSLVVGLSSASVALSVVLALWLFQRRGAWLGMDASVTLGLVGIGPLFVVEGLYVAELLGVVDV